MKVFVFLTTLSLLFCSVSPPAGAQAPANPSISVMKPGEGLGNIEIGDSISEVIKKMDGKKPDDGKTVKINSTTEYWLVYLELGVTFIFDERQSLGRIAVKNPAIVVQQNGLRVNSARTDLERVYGKGEPAVLDDLYEQIVYKERGITFTFNKKTEKIEVITIQSKIGN